MTGVDPQPGGDALGRRATAALEVALQHALGAELIDATDPAAGVRFPVTGLAVTPAGTLHAGALTVIIELAGYLAVLPTMPDTEHAVTHTISTQYLRAARAGDRVAVVGAVTRRARSLAFVSVVAELGEGLLIAHSQITKSIVSLAANAAEHEASPAQPE